MRFTWSPTSFRLIGGFAVILAIFAAAAVLSMRNLQRMADAMQELQTAQEALSAVHRMQGLALRQDAVQADLLVEEDYARTQDFYDASAQMARERQRVGEVLDSPQEQAWLRQCRDLQEALRFAFQSKFLPALASNDIGRAEDLRREGHHATNRIAGLCSRLRLGLSAKTHQAADRALGVQDAALRNSAMLLCAAVLASVVVSMWLARSIVRPIGELIEGTQAVSRGDLARRIELRRSDEFAKLAASFNQMTDTLRENQRQLVQAEKMASLGRLAAGVAHEINNPIGVILGYARVLLKDERLSEAEREELCTIEEEALQCKRIVQELLDLSRPMPAVEEPLDLTEVIGDVLDRASLPSADDRVRIVRRHLDAPLPVTGDRSKLRQAVQNIVSNAIEAMAEGGRLTVTGRRQRGPVAGLASAPAETTADFVTVEFHDSGCGIAADDLGSLFDPFFSRKSNGTGLGLSITYSIIRGHRGYVDVRSTLGKGTTFTVSLPARGSSEPDHA